MSRIHAYRPRGILADSPKIKRERTLLVFTILPANSDISTITTDKVNDMRSCSTNAVKH